MKAKNVFKEFFFAIHCKVSIQERFQIKSGYSGLCTVDFSLKHLLDSLTLQSKTLFFQVRQKKSLWFDQKGASKRIQRCSSGSCDLSQFQEYGLILRKFQSLVKTTLFFMHNPNEFYSPELETLQSNWNWCKESVLAPKKL